MEAEILGLLSSGADVMVVAIGTILIRMERRVSRLEYRIFGFGPEAEGFDKGREKNR